MTDMWDFSPSVSGSFCKKLWTTKWEWNPAIQNGQVTVVRQQLFLSIWKYTNYFNSYFPLCLACWCTPFVTFNNGCLDGDSMFIFKVSLYWWLLSLVSMYISLSCPSLEFESSLPWFQVYCFMSIIIWHGCMVWTYSTILLDPWVWRHYVPFNRWEPLAGHNVTSKKGPQCSLPYSLFL